MERKTAFAVFDMCAEFDDNVFITETRADAEELILSLGQEELYERYCYYNYVVNQPEEFDWSYDYNTDTLDLTIAEIPLY